MTKTRFAPSPTGLIHLGNVRTALFNALLAYRHQGIFLLRIEDTDQERSEDQYVQQLMEDLRWLGADWQEGPEHDKGHAPYYQSQRSDIYADYYAQLEAQKCVYPCFCSPQELAVSRKLQRVAGQAPRYAGTCAHLSPEEIEQKIAKGLQPTLRFRVPRGESIEFEDVVRDTQRFSTDDIGDFIIRRADGTPAFFFCNAVDDALMEVSHVLRGEDHLTNTPRQLMILQALGLPQPTYGHISLIVGADNSPLSKRHGSRSLKELRAEGWLPEGIVNYLARLGHAYGHDDFISFAQLAEQFDTQRLGKAPAKFDEQQLKHWQQQAVLQADEERIWQWMNEDTRARVPPESKEAFVKTVHPNLLFPSDAQVWASILCTDDWDYAEDAREELRNAGATFFEHAIAALEEAQVDWKVMGKVLKTASGKKGKGLFMPLRAALTGMTHGPEMSQVLPFLGVDKAKARLQKAQLIAASERLT